MEFTNPHEWQHISRLERVTGIEPALSAWEPTCCGQSTVADRLIERGVATRLSPRLTVSRRQFGHAEGTAQAIY
jgi:hypothetical protein